MVFSWIDLPAFLDQKCPCAYLLLTAYAHVRTEPQSDIGHTRRKTKKKGTLGSIRSHPVWEATGVQRYRA